MGSLMVPRPPPSGSISRKKKSLPWPVAQSQTKKKSQLFRASDLKKKRSPPGRAPDLKKKRSRRLAGPRISKKKKSPPGQAPDLKKKKEVAALGRPAGAEFPATSFLFDEKRYRYLFSLRPAGPGYTTLLNITIRQPTFLYICTPKSYM